jgi:cell wall-associated NlpC family hydrolase
LQPGDLVFFDTTGKGEHINHVGMYIGEGKFIQASSAVNYNKVVISDLSNGFYENSFLVARRYIH